MIRLDDKYTDENGKVWNTYREYCNSDEPDFDVKCVMLETGRRTPQNDWERDYVRNTPKYRKKGIPTELPFD